MNMPIKQTIGQCLFSILFVLLLQGCGGGGGGTPAQNPPPPPPPPPAQAPYVYVPNIFDSSVSVIDTSTNMVTDTIALGGSTAGYIAASASGNRAYATVHVTGTDSHVAVIDTTSQTITDTVDIGNSPSLLLVNGDGSRVYVASSEEISPNTSHDYVSVIDTSTNTVSDTFTGLGDGVSNHTGLYALASHPTNNTLYAGGVNHYIISVNPYVVNEYSYLAVIDTTTGNVANINFVDEGVWIQNLVMSSTGDRLYVVALNTNDNTNTVYVIDTSNNSIIDTAIGLPSGYVLMAIAPAGDKLYALRGNNFFNPGFVDILHSTSFTVLDSVQVGNKPNGIGVDPGGDLLYVLNEGSDSVSVIDTASNTVIDSVTVGSRPGARGAQFIGGGP